MTSLGFEVCREGHQNRPPRWCEQDDPPSRSSSSHSMIESMGIKRVSSSRRSFSSSRRADSSTLFAGDYSVASFVSADSSKSTQSTERRQKRKRSVWIVAIYLAVAAITFACVLIWYLGLFNSPDVQVDSLQDLSKGDGYDQDGRMLCNGSPLNCHRRANEMMYATVHNAMSSREDSFLAYNNLLPLEDALMAGFRGLTIDSCDCERIGIQLCHGLCVAGFRRPTSTFASIVEFMQQNVHEVIIIEIEVGGESLGPLFDILSEVPGFFDLLYDHPGPDTPWPMLKELIESGRRLIVFAHNDVGCEKEEQCPVGVKATFKYAFETPFAQKGVAELMDLNRTCLVSRGKSNANFIISNHFAANKQGLPDIEVATVVNSAENLQGRLDYCRDFFSVSYDNEVINLLVVDFWNVGDTIAIVNKYNSELPVYTEPPSTSPNFSPTETPPPAEALQTSTPSPVSTPQPSTTPTVNSLVEVPETYVPVVTAAPSTSLTIVPLMETLQPSDPATTAAPSFSLVSFFDSMFDTFSPTRAPSVTNNPNTTAPTLRPTLSTTQRPSLNVSEAILSQNPVMAINLTSIPMTQNNISSTAIGFEDATETLDGLVSSAFAHNYTTNPLSEEETQTPTTTEDQGLDAGDAAVNGQSMFLLEKDTNTPP